MHVVMLEAESSREAQSVVRFWREAGPRLWFAKDPEFDRLFRESFLPLHEAAAREKLTDWLSSPESALALVLLLDQFPRNAFRGTPRMYHTDALAIEMTHRALELGHDRRVDEPLQFFFYLPFGHSEKLEEQERSVRLNQRFGEEHRKHSRGHADIVRRFGRFPHRNPILGRTSTPEELKFLADGGFAG